MKDVRQTTDTKTMKSQDDPSPDSQMSKNMSKKVSDSKFIHMTNMTDGCTDSQKSFKSFGS